MRHHNVHRLLLAVLVAPLSQGRAQPAAGPRVPWLRVGMTSEWDSNVRFLPRDAAGDYFTTVAVAVLHARHTGRSTIVSSAHAESRRYAQASDLDGLFYEGRAGAAWRVTPRAVGAVNASYRTSVTTQLAPLGDVSGAPDDGLPDGTSPVSDAPDGPDAADAPGTPGLPPTRPDLPLLPRAISHTVSVNGVGAYRWTRLATGTVAVAYSSATFDSPALVSGRTAMASGELSRRVGRRSDILVRAEERQGGSGTASLRSHAFAAGVNYTHDRFAMTVLGGVASTEVSGARSVSPSADVVLATAVGRGSAQLRYARSVGQTFGLGEILTTDQVGLLYHFAGSRNNVFRLGATYATSADVEATRIRAATADGLMDWNRSFRSGALLGGGIWYRYRNTGARVSGTGARLGAGYTI